MIQLINMTASEIELDEVGITISASNNVIIPVESYLLFASADSISEITPYINSGDIIVNDGVSNLDSEKALIYIQYPNKAELITFSATSNIQKNNTQDAIQEAHITQFPATGMDCGTSPLDDDANLSYDCGDVNDLEDITFLKIDTGEL